MPAKKSIKKTSAKATAKKSTAKKAKAETTKKTPKSATSVDKSTSVTELKKQIDQLEQEKELLFKDLEEMQATAAEYKKQLSASSAKIEQDKNNAYDIYSKFSDLRNELISSEKNLEATKAQTKPRLIKKASMLVAAYTEALSRKDNLISFLLENWNPTALEIFKEEEQTKPEEPIISTPATEQAPITEDEISFNASQESVSEQQLESTTDDHLEMEEAEEEITEESKPKTPAIAETVESSTEIDDILDEI